MRSVWCDGQSHAPDSFVPAFSALFRFQHDENDMKKQDTHNQSNPGPNYDGSGDPTAMVTGVSSTADSTDEVLNRKQAAQLLGLSLAAFDRRKGIPRHIVGSVPRFVRHELISWVQAQPPNVDSGRPTNCALTVATPPTNSKPTPATAMGSLKSAAHTGIGGSTHICAQVVGTAAQRERVPLATDDRSKLIKSLQRCAQMAVERLKSGPRPLNSKGTSAASEVSSKRPLATGDASALAFKEKLVKSSSMNRDGALDREEVGAVHSGASSTANHVSRSAPTNSDVHESTPSIVVENSLDQSCVPERLVKMELEQVQKAKVNHDATIDEISDAFSAFPDLTVAERESIQALETELPGTPSGTLLNLIVDLRVGMHEATLLGLDVVRMESCLPISKADALARIEMYQSQMRRQKACEAKPVDVMAICPGPECKVPNKWWGAERYPGEIAQIKIDLRPSKLDMYLSVEEHTANLLYWLREQPRLDSFAEKALSRAVKVRISRLRVILVDMMNKAKANAEESLESVPDERQSKSPEVTTEGTHTKTDDEIRNDPVLTDEEKDQILLARKLRPLVDAEMAAKERQGAEDSARAKMHVLALLEFVLNRAPFDSHVELTTQETDRALFAKPSSLNAALFQICKKSHRWKHARQLTENCNGRTVWSNEYKRGSIQRAGRSWISQDGRAIAGQQARMLIGAYAEQ